MPWKQLSTSFLESPNGFWNLEITGSASRGAFRPRVWRSELNYKTFKNMSPWHEQFMAHKKLMKCPTRGQAVSESIVWANKEISNFDDELFTSEFDSTGRTHLNLLIERGDAGAESYIKSYFKKLEDRLSDGTKSEKHKALNSIIFILGRYPNWRPLLSEKLHVAVDELEDRGILITDTDIEPETLLSIRKSNPKTSGARSSIDKCRRLWERYCNITTKNNLNDVFSHLETMKFSKSENVKKERARCLRVANKEAKRLNLVK